MPSGLCMLSDPRIIQGNLVEKPYKLVILTIIVYEVNQKVKQLEEGVYGESPQIYTIDKKH